MGLFQKAYIINLDRRPDRFSAFMESCPEQLKSVIRFSAVDAKNMDYLDPLVRDNMITGLWNIFRVIIPGQFAAAMSHYKIWELIAKDPELGIHDKVLILEDDAVFTEAFEHAYNMNVDADILYLGGQTYPGHRPADQGLAEHWREVDGKHLFQRIPFAHKPGTYFTRVEAYIVNVKTARILVSHYRSKLITKHIDHLVEQVMSKNDPGGKGEIKVCDYFPNPCYQPPGISDIQVDTGKSGLAQSIRKTIPLPPLRPVLNYMSYLRGFFGQCVSIVFKGTN